MLQETGFIRVVIENPQDAEKFKAMAPRLLKALELVLSRVEENLYVFFYKVPQVLMTRTLKALGFVRYITCVEQVNAVPQPQ